VDDWVGGVIPNLGHSKGRDPKYAKIVDLYWHVKEMIAYNIGKQEVNHVIKKLKQMESKYDAFTNVILTGDEKENGEEDNVQKETPYVTVVEMEVGTTSNPINLDIEA
jgi:hypothetical protein